VPITARSETLVVGGYLRINPIYNLGNYTVTSFEFIAPLHSRKGNLAVTRRCQPKQHMEGGVRLTCLSTGGNSAAITVLAALLLLTDGPAFAFRRSAGPRRQLIIL
jgi:hypothetical protein